MQHLNQHLKTEVLTFILKTSSYLTKPGLSSPRLRPGTIIQLQNTQHDLKLYHLGRLSYPYLEQNIEHCEIDVLEKAPE
jgi:hypothetical protein